MRPPTRKRYRESAKVQQIRRPVQTKMGYGYGISAWGAIPIPTTNNFLVNKTMPWNLYRLTGRFAGRRLAIFRSSTTNKKKMDVPEVFGTRNQ